MTRRLLWSLAAPLVFPGVLYSQIDNTAAITGYVKSAFNGRPLTSVMISVAGTKKFAVTDSTGAFWISELPVGKQLIRISYLGRQTEEYSFELRQGKTKRLAVILDVEAVDLAPVVVTARHRDGWRDLAGFYERRRWYGGWGRFYTQEDLERLRLGTMSSVLAREGIYVRCIPQGCVPTKWVRGQTCAVSIAVDGMPFWEQQYDMIPIADVRGIEVYRGGSLGMMGAQPVSLQSNRAYPSCGWVEIWTR
jgi:hypothetical protein